MHICYFFISFSLSYRIIDVYNYFLERTINMHNVHTEKKSFSQMYRK